MISVIWLIVIVSVICQQSDVESAASAIPDAARQILEKNAADLSELEYEISIEHRMLADTSSLPDELQSYGSKAFMEHFLAPESNLVRVSGGRLYEKSIQGVNGGQIGERTFNGRVLYSGRPPQARVESLLTIDEIERRAAEEESSGFPEKHFYWNYFEEAGYHLPEFPQEFGESASPLVLHLAKQGRVVSWTENPATGLCDVVLESPDPWSQLKLTPDQITSAVSHLLGDSKKIQKAILERLVKRAETDPLRRYRLTLDPSSGLAMREKSEETVRGERLSHTVCEDFFKVENRDVWLPKTCRVLTYAVEKLPSYISATPMYETTCTLQKTIPKAFTDKDFELWYEKPGGSVFDYTAKGATLDNPVQYRVPADAAELAKASNASLFGLNRTRWLIIVNAAAVLAMIAIYILRHRQLPKA